MNQQKIGCFIAQMRKEREMTQRQLAEKIGVSDKAVSRWETGKGLPDTSIMPSLCESLGINVNELLSGERLSDVTYSGKAEENMVYLMKVSEDKKRNEKVACSRTIMGLALIVLIVWYYIFMCGGLSSFLDFLDIPSLLVVVCGSGLMLGVGGQMKAFLQAFGNAIFPSEEVATEEMKLELQNSHNAVIYAMKSFLFIGGLSFLIGVIAILSKVSEPSGIGKNFAVATLSLFYCLLFDAILLPISVILKKKLSQL